MASSWAVNEVSVEKANRERMLELVVDENALVDRMRKRVAETLAAGKEVRADDNPDSFKTRLDAYRAQTAPVSAHYASRGELKQVDGMKSIDEVSVAILGRPHRAVVLDAPAFDPAGARLRA